MEMWRERSRGEGGGGWHWNGMYRRCEMVPAGQGGPAALAGWLLAGWQSWQSWQSWLSSGLRGWWVLRSARSIRARRGIM